MDTVATLIICIRNDIMKLTNNQAAILRSVARNGNSGEWVTCSELWFSMIVKDAPSDLLETKKETNQVRLTEEGLIVLKWLT